MIYRMIKCNFLITLRVKNNPMSSLFSISLSLSVISVCVLDGQEFNDRQTWTLSSDRCSTCTCQVWLLHLCLFPPYLHPSLCVSANLFESYRQVRCSVHLLSVPSCLACIRWLIQEPAVLAVEVNRWLKINITGGNNFISDLNFAPQVVCMAKRSILRAAAGLQTPLPVWTVCVWPGWPPALKYAAYLPAATSSVCPGSAALCVLVSK